MSPLTARVLSAVGLALAVFLAVRILGGDSSCASPSLLFLRPIDRVAGVGLGLAEGAALLGLALAAVLRLAPTSDVSHWHRGVPSRAAAAARRRPHRRGGAAHRRRHAQHDLNDMAGRISDDAIREIRERASLIEVVSDVVALTRRGGRSAVGLCPFHAEKTPVVQRQRGARLLPLLRLRRARRRLQLRHEDAVAGVSGGRARRSPSASGCRCREDGAGQRRARSEPLVAVSEAAAAFFRGALRGPDGRALPRDYLAERGIRPEHDRALRPRLRAGRRRRPGAPSARAGALARRRRHRRARHAPRRRAGCSTASATG